MAFMFSTGFPAAPSDSSGGVPDASIAPLVVLPSTSGAPAFRSTAHLTPIVCDERAIASLLETLLTKAGITQGEASRRMGVSTNAIRQYIRGRRSKPSLIWFLRLADICGAKVTIEFPRSR